MSDEIGRKARATGCSVASQLGRLGLAMAILLLAAVGCRSPEKAGGSRERAGSSAAGEGPQAGSGGAPTEAVEEALSLLGDVDPESRAEGGRRLKAMGRPALAPLLGFFRANAPWVSGWAFSLDADQLVEKWPDPVGALVDFYLKHAYQPAASVTGPAAEFVTGRRARLADTGSDPPSLLVRGLEASCSEPSVDEVYVELGPSTEDEATVKDFLVVGTCEDALGGGRVPFRVVIAGDGSHVVRVDVHRRR